MAHKINPTTFRLGITLPWSSRWFYTKKNSYFLEEDCVIRDYVMKKIKEAGVASIDIERTSDSVRVIVRAARPGLIIGRGGKGIDDLRVGLMKKILLARKENKVTQKIAFAFDIEELRRTEVSSGVVAQQIATEIEKRKPYRMLLKRQIETLMQNKEIKGVKIKVSGRLNGAEISRSDWLAQGKMPLQRLRAYIDYGEATAFNTYGTVGIKVWLYKGDIFAATTQKEHQDH